MKKQRSSPKPPPSGVDKTLIRRMLSLPPAGRLRVLQANVRDILKLREPRRVRGRQDRAVE